jgi:hypothetical protein
MVHRGYFGAAPWGEALEVGVVSSVVGAGSQVEVEALAAAALPADGDNKRLMIVTEKNVEKLYT